MSLKKAMFFLLMLQFSIPTFAADWLYLGNDDEGGFHYLDLSSIQSTTFSDVTYWSQAIHADGSSVKAQYLVDCEKRLQKQLSIAKYNNDGKYLGQFSIPAPYSSPIIPDSIGEVEFKSACINSHPPSAYKVASPQEHFSKASATAKPTPEQIMEEELSSYLSKKENSLFNENALAKIFLLQAMDKSLRDYYGKPMKSSEIRALVRDALTANGERVKLWCEKLDEKRCSTDELMKSTSKKAVNKALFHEEKLDYETNPELAIENASSHRLTLRIGDRDIDIAPGELKKTTIEPGDISYSASAIGVRPLEGRQVFIKNYRYSWKFWVEKRSSKVRRRKR